MSQHAIEEILSREWKENFKSENEDDLAMTTTDEDNQVVPSFRGINCTRHLLRATIAIFHKFGKPGSEGYLKAEPDQLDATYLFSILRSTYQSFSFNHIGISWANEIQEPTLFDDIKNRPDDPSRRYIWVARVDEDGFREYRASSLIKETITLLESFPDWEISFLCYFFIRLRMDEENIIEDEWSDVLYSAPQFQRWLLAVFLAPQDVLNIFERENFYRKACWNRTGPESEFMAVNDGIADATVKIGDYSTLHVKFHVERLEFLMNNSSECAFSLIKFIQFLYNLAVVKKNRKHKKYLRQTINRHIEAVLTLHKEVDIQPYFDLFNNKYPIHMVLNYIRRLLSPRKLDRHERKMISRYNCNDEEMMEKLRLNIAVINCYINYDHLYKKSEKLGKMVRLISADRRTLSIMMKKHLNQCLELENLASEEQDAEMENFLKKAVKQCILNWKNANVTDHV